MQTRKCSKCGAVHPLTEEYFGRNQSTNTGGDKYFRPECKKCTKKASQGKSQAYKLAGKPPYPKLGTPCYNCGRTDKKLVFETFDNLVDSLKILNEVLKNFSVNKKQMLKLANEGHITATDLADYLVKNLNYPFRKSYEITATLVNYCEKHKKNLADLYEKWEYEERQIKYVVNGQKTYDFLNINWYLPLWESEFVKFWTSVDKKYRFRQNLYREYDSEIIITDPVSSQLIKYLANTYLPMRLSFVNEATRLSDYSGANLIDVLKGVGLDNRIGTHYFRPSPSWGGSCFPKDLVEVNNFYKKDELNLPLISNIIESNNEHLNWTVDQLLSLKNNNNLEQIVLVGAAFKENTDDLRNSPTLDIYKILVDMGVQVSILDTEIEVPNHNYISSVEGLDSKSLIAIMYPLNDDLDKKLLDYTSQNDCIIFYPWR